MGGVSWLLYHLLVEFAEVDEAYQRAINRGNESAAARLLARMSDLNMNIATANKATCEAS
jgi:hypothetical protein